MFMSQIPEINPVFPIMGICRNTDHPFPVKSKGFLFYQTSPSCGQLCRFSTSVLNVETCCSVQRKLPCVHTVLFSAGSLFWFLSV